ncbi:MAG: hypothetical protein MNPFHGCM_00237 [Gemmatimonadaceae bacterium]|nr:hypothetical protein [Gemmatimonadaceae bacterium]
MSIQIRRAVSRTVAGALVLFGATACGDKFLEVTNPNVIDAGTVNPAEAAGALAATVQQNFVTEMGMTAMFESHFTGETYIIETSSSQNEFGKREVSVDNPTLAARWAGLQLVAASGKILLDLNLPSPTTNINIARGAAFRAYSILYLAIDFCSGTLNAGPALNTTQLLDSAIFWFNRAVDVGTANGTTDGLALARLSLVGRARAKLQKGDKAGATADASAVPAGFSFNMNFTDDLANRARLSNTMWRFTVDRGTISVPPYYQTTDPRVTFLAPGQHKFTAVDQAAGPFYVQQKFPTYAAPIRLASKLEAEYIVAEASGDANQQLALIDRQRAAAQQQPYSGPTDAASILAELFFQKGYDFWLEGKRMADWRRQPVAASRYVPVAGSPYWRTGFGSVGTQVCYPVPRTELDNNPNLKQTS